MAALTTPVCDFGLLAIDFSLPATSGSDVSMQQCMGKNGMLVMFICNHCPYVKAILPRLAEDCRTLGENGIGCVAISANDVQTHPDDSFDNMKKVAGQFSFPFPYVYDESQQVARAYGAVCTPDFFGYNNKGELQYRGRFDDSGTQPRTSSRRELLEAMLLIGKTGNGPKDQIPSIGCSIKWR